MKKIILTILLAVMATLLSSCGLKAPNENDLAQLIPDEVLQYEVDGVQYTSNVDSFTLIRRQTNEKDDYAECEIVLSDDNFVRFIKIAFYTKYYDVGGWQLETWNILEKSTTEVKLEYSLEALKDYIESQGYMLDSDATVDSSPGNMYYVGSILAEEHKYLTYSGQVVANVMLETNDSSYYMPMSYTWDIQISPQIEYQWDVLGTWYGEPDLYYVTLTIDELANKYCSGVLEAKYDSTRGGIGSYGKRNNTDKTVIVEGTTVADMTLFTTMYGGFPYFGITFYPDEAYIACSSGLSSTGYGTWVPLTRQ